MKVRIQEKGRFKLFYFELPYRDVDPIAVAMKIEELKSELNCPKTVLVRGQGPTWLYAMWSHAAHATPNFATYEPRRGEGGGYVVIHQHGGNWAPGEIIPAEMVGMNIERGEIIGGESANPPRRLVVSIGGPKHSGKTVFMAELYRQLLERMPGEVFRQSANTDGEGMRAAEANPALVQSIRQKGSFSGAFNKWVVDSITGLKKGFAITLLDLGGKRLPPNDDVLRASSHLIVLSSDPAETQAWVEYGQGFGCEIFAVMESQLIKTESGALDNGARSHLEIFSQPITGTLVNLDREAPSDPYRQAVASLSNRLIVEAGL